MGDRVVRPAIAPEAARAVMLRHRGHEHSGQRRHLVEELDLPGYAMFAWDARGHGLSPRRGHAPGVRALVKDLDTFVREAIVAPETGTENLALVGQSARGVLAAAWVHDYAPRVRCMVLAAPAFKVKLYVPFARQALRMLYRLFGDFNVRSYVNAKFLTYDQSRIAEFHSDPLISRAISVKVLLGLFDTAARVVQDGSAIHVPTQLLISGSAGSLAGSHSWRFLNGSGRPSRKNTR
ncbi:MAG: alpha/beta fold hydrolase [Bryobacteraceae bacterium]